MDEQEGPAALQRPGLRCKSGITARGGSKPQCHSVLCSYDPYPLVCPIKCGADHSQTPAAWLFLSPFCRQEANGSLSTLSGGCTGWEHLWDLSKDRAHMNCLEIFWRTQENKYALTVSDIELLGIVQR